MSNQYSLLHQYLVETAKRLPNKTAIVYNDKKTTYYELNQYSDLLATKLVQLGVKRGDRVVVKLGNSVETIIAFWGVLKAQAVVSIIGDDIKSDKLLYILHDSGASVLITTNLEDNLLEHINKECKFLHSILLHNVSQLPPNYHSRVNLSFLSDAIYNVSQSLLPDVIDNTSISLDVASIIYTSGSTGEPKGVTLTHRNMLVASNSINKYLENGENEVIICVLPLSFDYGLYQMIMATAVGATLVLEKDFVWPQIFIRNIIKHNVTAVPCVPSMVSLLGEYIKRKAYDLNTVRYVTNTGAALTQRHINAIKEIFPVAKIFSMYGLTECKRCTYLPPKDIDRKPESVGIAIPNTELWVVDDQGNRVGPGKIGQLVIRGETVMKGYWNKPKETAERIGDGPLPFEKVLYTGDYAELDDEGYLYFRGRMDEVIKSRGIKVSPKEIEDVVACLAGVKEAAVFGIESEQYGQEICALVAPNSDANIVEDDILKICKEKLEKEKIPTIIKIMPNMPKNNNGKIDKQALKQTIVDSMNVAT